MDEVKSITTPASFVGDPPTDATDELRRKISETEAAMAADKEVEEKWVQEINERHFYAPVGGVGRIWEVSSNGVLPMRLETFKANYCNVKVQVKKGDTFKFVEKGAAWIRHPKRRQFLGGVGCYPKAGTCPPDQYNLWQDFAVDPKPGDWSLFKEHLDQNVCQSDPELTEYLYGWMAHLVQHPEKPAGVALVLRGPQAVGKTIVGEHLGHLFGEGRHFLTISHQQHITSRFNSHLANIILLLIDEATFPGDKSAWGHFKSLLTSPMLTIERKGTDIFTMPNFLHVILTSNSDWVVPVESFDRRWCVIDVGASRCKDTSFFKAMNEQLISGGYSGLLYDLLRMPLINLLSIPNTTARIDQKIHTMDPLEKWWLAILQSGELPGSDFEPRFSLWGETERRHLYGSYKDAVGKYPLDVSLWRKKLTTLSGLEDGPHRRTGIRGRQRTYKFPTLSECRARFERVMGVKIEWEKDDDAPHLTVVPAPDKVAAVEGGAV